MKNLPIGVSSLEKIVQGGFCYVDKTHHVANLANSGGGYYFLSRPRRFGKSLLVDTLKQAFLGRRELFEGLYLESNWDWSVEYPVIHISFGGSSAYNSQQRLLGLIHNTLQTHARFYGVTLSNSNDYGLAFQELIYQLSEKYQQRVVLLIDEYDKPILDVITDSEQAVANREILKGLYGFIKECDAYLKFVLLTGVSKFSKVNLFSGLNNLRDITLSAEYADICGYTQSELEQEFVSYLQSQDVDLERLKLWYNGYNFSGTDEQTVYNPFDILLFFNEQGFYKPYWFETATPSFLVRLIEKNQYFIPSLENTVVPDDMLSGFDVGYIPIETLLFQTGYLTIKRATSIGLDYAYELTYPNLEVKMSLNRHLASIGTMTPSASKDNRTRLVSALMNPELEQLDAIFKSFFASIPHAWYKKHDMHRYEGFYASIVYSYLASLGYDLIPEDITNYGKIDLTMKLPDKIVIFEFKLNRYGTAGQAIEQIKDRQYPQQYESEQFPIYLVGISFDEADKNIDDFEVELLN